MKIIEEIKSNPIIQQYKSLTILYPKLRKPNTIAFYAIFSILAYFAISDKKPPQIFTYLVITYSIIFLTFAFTAAIYHILFDKEVQKLSIKYKIPQHQVLNIIANQ